MATSRGWKLKRYGRFVPGSTKTRGHSWKKLKLGSLKILILAESENVKVFSYLRKAKEKKPVWLWITHITVFEADGNKPEIILTIVESGYLLVVQGQESLDTVPLLCGSDCLNVHQKSDNLMLRLTLKGESRMMRMQFDGSSKAEAIEECSSALEKLMEYMPVTTQDDAPLPPNQPPSETCQVKAVGDEPEVARGSLSLKRLTQHFLGETAVTLPQIYHYNTLAQGDLEPILRVCLLDPTFPAFVEKVEEELKKLVQE